MAAESGVSGEKGLWLQFRSSRCQQDRDVLVTLYEPFAKSIAVRMFQLRIDDSVSFDDYMQYSRIGLLEAVDRYDADRGVSFSSFSSPRIRGAILNGIAKESEDAAQTKFWRRQARDRVVSLSNELTTGIHDASLLDIASITMGLAVGVLLEDGEPGDAGADTELTTGGNDPYAANEVRQLSAAAFRLVERLPERERAVIVGHYLEQQDFSAVAQRLALSKGRISQLHAQALLRLRDWLERRTVLDRKV